MNLIKWLRKNSKKVMAVVVVIIMVGFIGGGTILQHLASLRSEQNQPYAFFADNKKITYSQLNAARQELETLKMLQSETILRSSDIRSALLGELLFSESRNAGPFVNQLIQVINNRGFDISRQQLYDIYNHQHPNSLYWILLTEEAKNAGVNISNQQAGEILGRIIPQLYEGASYSLVIGQIVNRYQLPEEDILTAFAKLLTVLEYSKAVCETQDITISQLAKDISRQRETFDVNFIQVDSVLFAKSQPEPTQQQIDEHFQKYKMYLPQSVDQNNPYGFGYKLHDRVQLEYIAVKLDDISGIIEKPKPDEIEQY